MENRVAVGIDLGTTMACAGVWVDDHVEIICNDYGNRTTPSYVAYQSDGIRLVGEDAKNQLIRNPTNTLFDIKRLIGRPFDDMGPSGLTKYPFQCVKDDKGQIRIDVEENGSKKRICPEEVSSIILGQMKKNIEERLNCVVKEAVITVPAYFNDAQRESTRLAGKIAGIDVIGIINEPTAAAVAYGLNKSDNDFGGQRNVLVFDLGGGTFDVSILVLNGVKFNVKSTNGHTQLGGEDFNENMMKNLKHEILEETEQDISGSPECNT